MKISYCITVYNEVEEFKRLLTHLLKEVQSQDEIIILCDTRGGKSEELESYCKPYLNQVEFYEASFGGHFADWKNSLSTYCSGEYIFQLDADEVPSASLIQSLPEIFRLSGDVDVLFVPRINTVKGITQEHIEKWGWRLDARGWINFPDYQQRIYKNTPDIKWVNKVHEVLSGYKSYASLPQNENYSLIHEKTIERQEKQNELYTNLATYNSI